MVRPVKLLLIDDSPDDRTLTVHNLRRQSWDLEVVEVTDGSGLAAAIAEGGFDAAVVDYLLRWSDGLTVLRELKVLLPDLPVVMFTGSGSEELAVTAMKSGLDDYLIKTPGNYRRLPDVVSSVIEDRRSSRLAGIDTATEQSRRRYQHLIENSSGLMCTHDPDGTLQWVNPAIAKLLGYDPADMPGRSLAEFIRYREDLEPYLATTQESGEFHGTVEARTKDGEFRILRFHNVMLTSPDGSSYVLGHASDVTELLRAEKQLDVARARMDRLIAASPAVVYTVQADTFEPTYVSPNVRGLMGHTYEEIVGDAGFWANRIHPDDWPEVLRNWSRLTDTGRLTQRYRFRHADGSYRWMRDEQRLTYDEDGDPHEISGHWLDITEEKRLADDVERFFDVSLDLLCIVGFDGRLRRLNPAWVSTLGHAPAVLLSQSLAALAHPDDVGRTLEWIGRLTHGDSVADLETRYMTADGEYRWLLWNAVSYPDEAVFYAGAHDITEIKAREIEYERARMEADRANEAKGDFLANVSHEIRTPMNGVIGMTELALDTDLSNQQREYLQMVQSSSMALLDVINGVLDFSKIEAGKLQIEAIDFTLQNTLTGALKPLALAADEKGVELLYDEGPDIPGRLRGDPGRLRQVLNNLVGNAVKFTMVGEVRLTLEKVRDLDHGVELRFAVSDTGIGIPPDQLPYVFDSFHQADGSTTRRFGGTGLGLSISSGIVKMMGGDITVESTEGEGSVFSFTAQFGSAAVAKRPQLATPRDLEGTRVLVVDDNAANRTILEGYLRRLGMEAMVACSAAEALQLMREALGSDAPVDMAVLDVHMPDVDGFQLAEQIRADAALGDVALFMLTSAGRPGDGARCEELGISSYLLKPVTPGELRDAILLTLSYESREAEKARLVTRHSLREAWASLDILLAEDNGVNQTLATAILTRLGHTVTLAVNGVEALELSRDHEFDLILMDISMPEMGGIEATQRIREREGDAGGHIPIVAMTAHAMAGDRTRFIEAGMDEYISKPISADGLREVVRNLGRSSKRD